MSVTVRDNPELNRYEVLLEDAVAGFTDYRLDAGRISFLHTEIDEAFNGRGLGKELVGFALEDVRRRGLSVLPFCPYVRKVIARNPDAYLDLVPEEERSQFDLPVTV